jgi:hypothetical protein
MGSRGIAPSSLTPALEGVEWAALRSGRFSLGEEVPGSHCVGGWVGLRAGVNSVEKSLSSLTEIETRPSLYRLSSPGHKIKTIIRIIVLFCRTRTFQMHLIQIRVNFLVLFVLTACNWTLLAEKRARNPEHVAKCKRIFNMLLRI